MKKNSLLRVLGFWCLSLSAFTQVRISLEKELDYSRLATVEALLQIERVAEAQQVLNKINPASCELEHRFLRSMADQGVLLLDTVNSLIQTITSHSPTGLLAVGGVDKNIYLIRISDWSIIRVFAGHTGSITTLDFSPDGKLIVSGSRDKSVKMWNVLTGELIANNNTDFNQGIYQVKFAPDGTQIGVVSWELLPQYGVNGFAVLLRSENLAKISKQNMDQHPAAGFVFHPSERLCFISTWGEIIYGFSLPDWKLLWKYDLSDPAEYNAFYAIDITQDGTTLAVGSADHKVHLLESKSGRLIDKLAKNAIFSRPVKTLDFHPNGKRLAVSGEDGMVSIWDIDTKEVVAKLAGHTSTINALQWVDDSKILTASQDTTMRTWDVVNSFLQETDICSFGPWQLPVWTKKSWLIAPCSDEKLSVYDLVSGKEVSELGKVKGLCGSVSKDDKLATADFNGIVSIWDLKKGSRVTECKGHTARVDGVAWTSDGRLVTVGDKTLRMWNDEGKSLDSLLLDYAPFRVVSFDKYIAVSNPKQVVIYDTQKFMEIKRIDAKGNGIQEILFSPRGSFLCIYTNKNIEVYRTENWALASILSGHELSGYAMDVSEDEKYLISGSNDQTLRIWDLTNGINSLTFHGFNKGVYGCKFVGEKRIIASTSEGKLFRLNLNK